MKLSILMPMYNEEARLPEAMKQALGVDYPCEIELVIVDDGSKDRTPEILAAAEVVYGNRVFGSHSSFSFWYVMGNKFVTTAANVLYNCYLFDIETCYKLMPLELYRSLNIRAKGFGMDPMVTGRLLRRGVRPYEVPISYRARTREEGKKITWQDGVQALWILARERVRRVPK